MADRKSTYNNLQNNTQKDRQHNGQSVGHCIFCPSVYCFVDCCMYFFCRPLCCLSFCVLFCRLLFVLFLSAIAEKVQITIYKTIHRRTDNTMAKRKSTYNNLQSTFSFGHCIVCPSVYCFVDCCMYFFFWPLYCLSFCVLFCRLLFVLFLYTQKDRQYNGQKKKYIQQSTKQYTEE
jgi:hypothetical protein